MEGPTLEYKNIGIYTKQNNDFQDNQNNYNNNNDIKSQKINWLKNMDLDEFDLEKQTKKKITYVENPYFKYTIYGRYGQNVCGRRCKTLVSNKLFQKCCCKEK
jgi:hypothetical protein